jgi:hypothetical protein
LRICHLAAKSTIATLAAVCLGAFVLLTTSYAQQPSPTPTATSEPARVVDDLSVVAFSTLESISHDITWSDPPGSSGSQFALEVSVIEDAASPGPYAPVATVEPTLGGGYSFEATYPIHQRQNRFCYRVRPTGSEGAHYSNVACAGPLPPQDFGPSPTPGAPVVGSGADFTAGVGATRLTVAGALVASVGLAWLTAHALRRSP